MMAVKSRFSASVVMPRYCFRHPFALTINFIMLACILPNSEYVYALKTHIVASSNVALFIRFPYSKNKSLLGMEKRDSNNLCLHLLFQYTFSATALLWLYILLQASGDIHPNPGTTELDSSTSSDKSIASQFLSLSSHLSLVHYNVQSLLPKVDIIEAELRCFDVIAITETWLNDSISDDNLTFHDFHCPVRKDRVRDGYGGVILYVKNTIHFVRRGDLEVNETECIWIELKLSNKHVLIGVFYRAPNSDNLYFTRILDSIGLAIDTGIVDVIITGDFNFNTLSAQHSRKIVDLCMEFNLRQCIDVVTHYTEHSSSLIDLLLVNKLESLIKAGVSEPFLTQNTRYHCPIFGIFNFHKPKHKTFKRLVWQYDKANYNLLRTLISSVNWSSLVSKNINEYAQNVTDVIIEHSKASIPNRNVNIRPNDIPWMTNEIKKNIRRRKRLFKRAKTRNSEVDWSNFRRMRNMIVSMIRNSKKAYFST